ncbi:hypothetical protein Cni_G15625 [Canna indica]|uniref:Uncharacterized protein n=1 Tax=Canna indica TaxID=4628 RepID=A0AAQ3QBT0_9LILI|nr:hypothetical protein Cni_G15625 [Canna indica]
MERLSLIDISGEDDLLVPSPLGGVSIDESFSGVFGDLVENKCCQSSIMDFKEGVFEDLVQNNCCQSFILDSKEGGSPVNPSNHMEPGSQLPESPKQNESQSSRNNMRKSLAWDSAFFTCEGVLNHEELGIVNSTFKKTELRSLPVVLEDVAKSTESTSSLDDDNWGLENLEVNLFDNVQASIQRTRGTAEKAVKLTHSSKKDIPEKGVGPPLKCNRWLVLPQNKSSVVALERNVVGNSHREQTSRVASVISSVGNVGISTSKAVLPPPRVLPRATTPTIPIKKSSVSGNTQIRTNNTKEKPGTLVTQKSNGVTKKMNEGPCNGTLKSSPSPTANSASNPLNQANKSCPKITNTSRLIRRSSSEPVANKVSLKTSKTKTATRSPRNPAVSPSSSVYCSSDASSTRSSFDSTAPGSSSSSVFGIKPRIDVIDANSPSTLSEGVDNDKIHSSGSKSNNAAFESSRKGNHHQRSSNSNGLRAKCYKPSGLKMPTPKHGYFDPKKTPTYNSQTLPPIRQQLNFPKAQHISPLRQNMDVKSECPQTQDISLSRTPNAKSLALTQLSKLVESSPQS